MFSPDSRFFCVGTPNEIIMYNTLQHFKIIWRHRLYYLPNDIAFTLFGDFYILAIAGSDGIELFWLNESTGSGPYPLKPSLIHQSHSISLVKFNGRGDRLAVAALDGHVGLWKLSQDSPKHDLSWELLFTYLMESERLTSLHFSNNDRLLCVGAWDQRILCFSEKEEDTWDIFDPSPTKNEVHLFPLTNINDSSEHWANPTKINPTAPGVFLTSNNLTQNIFVHTFLHNTYICINEATTRVPLAYCFFDAVIKGMVALENAIVMYTRCKKFFIIPYPPHNVPMITTPFGTIEQTETRSFIIRWNDNPSPFIVDVGHLNLPSSPQHLAMGTGWMAVVGQNIFLYSRVSKKLFHIAIPRHSIRSIALSCSHLFVLHDQSVSFYSLSTFKSIQPPLSIDLLDDNSTISIHTCCSCKDPLCFCIIQTSIKKDVVLFSVWILTPNKVLSRFQKKINAYDIETPLFTFEFFSKGWVLLRLRYQPGILFQNKNKVKHCLPLLHEEKNTSKWCIFSQDQTPIIFENQKELTGKEVFKNYMYLKNCG